jgi:CubicO group peptidase (beta-lactamase class C family)
MQVAAQVPSEAEIRKILAERVSARRQAVGITAGIIDAAGRRVITFGDLDTTNGRCITLRDLATHTSGLPRIPSNMDPADATNPYGDYSAEKLYLFLSTHELKRDPGSEFEYSKLAASAAARPDGDQS